MATNGVQSDVGALKDDIQSIRNEVGVLMQDIAKIAKRETRNAKDGLASQASHGLEAVKETFGRVSEQGTTMVNKARSEIQRRPEGSVLIALGVGFLVGRLLGMGRSSER